MRSFWANCAATWAYILAPLLILGGAALILWFTYFIGFERGSLQGYATGYKKGSSDSNRWEYEKGYYDGAKAEKDDWIEKSNKEPCIIYKGKEWPGRPTKEK